MTEHAHDLWDRCRGELEAQVSGGVFLMYFEPTEALEVEGSTLVLGVPSVMARDRLDVRYRPLIDDALAEHAPEITDLRFVVVATDPVEADLLDLPHPSRLDDQNADPFDELPLLDELPVPPPTSAPSRPSRRSSSAAPTSSPTPPRCGWRRPRPAPTTR